MSFIVMTKVFAERAWFFALLICLLCVRLLGAFSALMLSVGRQENCISCFMKTSIRPLAYQ